MIPRYVRMAVFMPHVARKGTAATVAHIEAREKPWPVLRCRVCGVARHFDGPGDVDCHTTDFGDASLPARDVFALDHAACAKKLAHRNEVTS